MSSKKVRINWTDPRLFFYNNLFIRVTAYLQRMCFICSYCGLFANNVGSWQLLVILVGGRQRAEGRGQKAEERKKGISSKFKL